MRENEQVIGETLSHYKILRKLGSGGMGEVYLAEDLTLGRTVAIKILAETLASNPERMHRFIREAKAASALKHPNVASIHELGELNGKHFIVMEYVEGARLDQVIRNEPLDSSSILDYAIQIADALDEAHEKGIIHRDLKPANVMLTSRGQIKVLDFGVAKLIHETTPDAASLIPTETETKPGLVLGTVPYMSPEQALGKQVDARSDLFSLGSVLYQLATGRLPFPGETSSDMMNRIINNPPEAIARFNYSLPQELERIIRKCLEKDPDRRYQSARDLLIDLKNLKRDTESVAIRPAARPRRFQAIVPIVLFVAVSIGLYFLLFHKKSGREINSIAVLPFVNLQNDSASDYLSDGLTESVIKNLSEISQLRVMAPASVFRFKNTSDPIQAGKELKVKAILTGKLSRQGNDLMISADLVDVSNGVELWGKQYRRGIADLIGIQEEISREISDNLRLKLSGEQQHRLTKRYTQNAEAYQLYLKARYYWNKRNADGIKKSIELFQQAIDRDPTYALAYSGLADSYCVDSSPFPPKLALPRAKAAAEKALQIDDSVAEAHTSMGCVKQSELDWAGAAHEFRRSIELNSNYPTAHQWYGEALQALGKREDSLAEIRRALELDPLSLVINSVYAAGLYFSRRYDEALAQIRRTLEMDPSFQLANYWYFTILGQKGLFVEAADVFQKVLEQQGKKVEGQEIGDALRKASRQGAEQFFHTFADWAVKGKIGPAPPAIVAAYYSAANDPESAFRWLETTYQNDPSELAIMNVDPRFDNIRTDPRFHHYLRLIHLEP